MSQFTHEKMKEKIKIVDAKIKSINTNNYTATADFGNNKYNNITLRALNEENKKGFIIIPKLDSYVTLLIRENTIPYIFRYTEISKIIISNDDNFTFEIDIENNNFTFENDTTTLEIQDNKVVVTTNNIELNGNSEPLVRGNKNKTHIDNLYGYINDIYTKFIAHTHTGNLGVPTPLNPPELTTIPGKITEVAGDSALTNEILSTKNYTE